MSDLRLLDRAEQRVSASTEGGALALAAKLPSLIVAAKEVAASVTHGMHGRRRAGIGETFWQFRPFVAGKSTTGIDWRRSARDDRIYIREREWEAAHSVAIWIDRSPSMGFISNLARQSKSDRALVLGLAAADLLVRGGERVSLLGLTRPLASRSIVAQFAEAMIAEERAANYQPAELAPNLVLPPRSHALLISDFLSDPAQIAARIKALAARGAHGYLVMIADPAEETFPLPATRNFSTSILGAAARRAGGEFPPRIYRPSRRPSRGDTAGRASTRLDASAAPDGSSSLRGFAGAADAARG